MIEIHVLEDNNSARCIACGDLADLYVVLKTEGKIVLSTVHHYCTGCSDMLTEALQETLLSITVKESGEGYINKFTSIDDFVEELDDEDYEAEEGLEQDGVAVLSKDCNCENVPCD